MRVILLLWLWAPCLVAAETSTLPSEPVLVVLRTHYAAPELGDTGLIGAWATSSVNKYSASKVETFTQRLADPDFPQKLRLAFACIARPGPCDSAQAFGDPAQFETALRNHPGQEGFLVEVVPELGANQLLIRATAYRMKLANDVQRNAIRTGDGYHALFTWRAPPAILATKQKGKRTSPQLDAWWVEGEPRRLNDLTRRGLVEINHLLELLIHKSKDGYWSDGRPVVSVWDYPNKKALACRSKQACSLIYVLEERDAGFVLVHAQNNAGFFDRSAAAHGAAIPIDGVY
jgi:hypothetical protein